jgi:L-asparagine oxygenase
MLPVVQQDGYVLHKRLAPHLSTVEIAQTLGRIVNVDELLPSAGIPSVQSLKPREAHEVRENQYSRHFGLGSFPLHTDLAHWALPPRYLLLRCLVGTSDVITNVLSWAHVVDSVGVASLQKAVFTGRKRRVGYSGLVRALSHRGENDVFRWDPVFLQPLNQHAEALVSVMRDPKWNGTATKILLNQPGDSILIDNWRMLHGRSQVLAQSTSRHVERIYLSEVFQ